MKQAKGRGVALVGVLLLMVTLSMLAAALVSVHRGHWALARGQDQRIAAHQTCLSAIEYARNRLQADSSWGTAPFGGNTVRLQIPHQLRASEQGSSLANNRVEFELLSDDSRATLQIANNLKDPSTDPDPTHPHQPLVPPFPTWRQLRVPAESVLLVAVGRNGGQTRRVEVLLRRRPPLDGAMYSGEDLAMIPNGGGSTSEFDGEDATKNKLRARGHLYLPGQARFLRRGAATGRDDVRVGATISLDANGDFPEPSTGTSLKNSPGQQATLEGQLGGSLNIGPVPQLRLDVGDLHTAAGGVHPLPAGKYTFVGPGEVEFQPDGGGPTVVYHDAIYDGGASSGSPAQLVAALSGRKFMLQGQVESNGTLEFDSLGGVSQAEVALGYHPTNSGLDEPGKLSSLRLRGDLKVRGHVVGQGTVAALKQSGTGGNITISGRSTLSSATTTGLALYSEGDLRMRPTEDSGDVTLAADFEALKLALTDEETSNPNLFRDVNAWEKLTDADPVGDLRGRENTIGQDETRTLGDNSTANVRDSRIRADDYLSQVQPLIPHWNENKTPSGVNDLPQAAIDFAHDCLTLADTPQFAGGMTVGRHARLMAFLRSVDEGNPDPGWLAPVDDTAFPDDKYNDLIKGNLKNLLSRVAQDARLQGSANAEAWLTEADQFYKRRERRDIDWRGMIYAKGRLWGDGNEKIDIVGALASETGSLVFNGFTDSRVKFHHSELNSAFQESSLQLEGYAWYLD